MGNKVRRERALMLGLGKFFEGVTERQKLEDELGVKRYERERKEKEEEEEKRRQDEELYFKIKKGELGSSTYDPYTKTTTDVKGIELPELRSGVEKRLGIKTLEEKEKERIEKERAKKEEFIRPPTDEELGIPSVPSPGVIPSAAPERAVEEERPDLPQVPTPSSAVPFKGRVQQIGREIYEERVYNKSDVDSKRINWDKERDEVEAKGRTLKILISDDYKALEKQGIPERVIPKVADIDTQLDILKTLRENYIKLMSKKPAEISVKRGFPILLGGYEEREYMVDRKNAAIGAFRAMAEDEDKSLTPEQENALADALPVVGVGGDPLEKGLQKIDDLIRPLIVRRNSLVSSGSPEAARQMTVPQTAEEKAARVKELERQK